MKPRGAPSPARLHGALIAALVCSLLCRGAAADDACADLAPWNRLSRTANNFGQARPLILAGTAPLVTGAMVPTGVDHRLRVYGQTSLGGHYDLEPVSLAAPYVIAGALLIGYGISWMTLDCQWQRPQAAVLQAMGLSAAGVALLKWTTGRQFPNAGRDPRAADRLGHPEFATDFKPFRRFGAWPSGHTATMFAAAAALRVSEQDWGWPAWLGYPFAAGVGFGMWLSDRHWASDIAAGALLGEAIGSSVGEAFRNTSPALGQVSILLPGDGVALVWVGMW